MASGARAETLCFRHLLLWGDVTTMQPGLARYRAYTLRDLNALRCRYGLADELVEELRVVGAIFPFRVNAYVLDELIDFERVPDDPIYRMVFPHREMLEPDDYRAVAAAQRAGLPVAEIAIRIRDRLNPHCSDQQRDVPWLKGTRVDGLQHKYAESLLVFPSASQMCHAFCAYCFRFPQFVPTSAGMFEMRDPAWLRDYLDVHPEVTDVIYTGGDPFTAAAAVLRRFVEPVLSLPAVRSVRFGTKSLAYWPQRFITDADAPDLLALLREIVAAGKHVAVMYHSSHPRELSTPAARAALARVRETGAEIRTQAPIVRGINDSAAVWRELWSEQIRNGCIPYYVFAGRQTGGHACFDVPLARALDIVRDAGRNLPGIATSFKGPVMSTAAGKIEVLGVVTVGRRDAFALRFVRGADPAWTGRTFLAEFDGAATWLDTLRPFESERFFFDRQAGRRVQAGAELAAQG